MLATYILSFLFLVLLGRFINKDNFSLVIEIAFSLISIVFLFNNYPLVGLQEVPTNLFDLFLIVSVLIFFGVLKLLEIIVKDYRSPTDISKLLLLLFALAVPSIELKFLYILYLFSLSVDLGAKREIIVPTKGLFVFCASLVMLLFVKESVVIFFPLYLLTFIILWNYSRFEYLVIFNSIALSLSLAPLWLAIGSTLFMFFKIAFFLLDISKFSFSDIVGNKFMPAVSGIQRHSFYKEKYFEILPSRQDQEIPPENIRYIEYYKDLGSLGRVLFWTIMLFLISFSAVIGR